MDLIIQISGLFFLMTTYFFSDVFFKFKEQHLKLLAIYIILYFEILILSIFKLLNYQTLIVLSLLKLFYIFLKRDNITKIKFKNKNQFVNLTLLIVYLIYSYLSINAGFTIDDVLVSYLTRVNQWIQNQSVFLTLDLYPYYSTILTYPIGSPLSLLVIKLFKLPDYFFLLMSIFVTFQILLTIKKFFRLNEKEYNYLKFILPLSPIILVLSVNGLSDLIFSYFLINSFYYVSNFYKNNNKEYLYLSSVFAVFSSNIKYHGLFVLFIVGLIVLFSKRIENIFKFAKYTFINILIFLFPNIIWQFSNDIFRFLRNNIETQFNKSPNYVQSIELGVLSNFDVDSLIFDFYNSFTHTFINNIFVDFPMLYFLRDLENPYILFIRNYNVFSKTQQVPTLGPIIFILCLFSIYYLLENFSKNIAQKKNLVNFTIFIISIFLIFLVLENFFVALTILLVGGEVYRFLKNKEYDINLKEVNMNLNIVLFILVSYFSLISIRDFNDSNLRYLFPILLFIFPFGLKAISNHITSSKLKIFIIISVLISSIQPIFFNTLVTVNTPELMFNSNKYEIVARNWRSCPKDLIKDVYKNYDYLIEKNPSFNTLISTNEKFPISIFDKNNIYFSSIDTSLTISSQYFDKYNSNILIISEAFFNYDPRSIHLLNLNSYETIQSGKYDYYIINLYQLDRCRGNNTYGVSSNNTTNTTVPTFIVNIDGKNYFYTQTEIEDGTVERDTQRIKNEKKWNCYMTDAQVERGDCEAYNASLDN